VVSYNEGDLVRRALQAAACRTGLRIGCTSSFSTIVPTTRWPLRARKVAELQATGVDIVIPHRDRRDDYKAGALAKGMAASSHEYFAIFDIDYVPRPDFLRRCMAIAARGSEVRLRSSENRLP
jgi:cellulose synthase/poly-beta-1,6-N-acetylglucosamine synthase-like glycosyltransferase